MAESTMIADGRANNTRHADPHTKVYPRDEHAVHDEALSPNTPALDDTVARIIQAAKKMVGCSTSPSSYPGMSRTFVLHHPRPLDLLYNALRLNGVESGHKLRIEYHADRGRLRLTMTDSPLHSRLAVLFSDLVHAASKNKLRHLDNVLSYVPTQGETGRSGRLSPDWGWTALPHDPMPRLVFEVAYSQDLQSVTDKCQEYLSAAAGIVCAVISIKICYSKSKPAALATILEHLDDCFLGL